MDVAKPMIVLLFANFLVLGLWTGIDPLRYEQEVVIWDGDFDRPLETYGVCRSDNALPFLVSLGVLNMGALLFSVLESARSKGFVTENNESSYIFKALAGILSAFFVGVPVLVIAHDADGAYYYVFSALIFLTCSLVLLLIFVPKMRIFYRRDTVGRGSMDEHARVRGSSNGALGRYSDSSGVSAAGRIAKLGINITIVTRKKAREVQRENQHLLVQNDELRRENQLLHCCISQLQENCSDNSTASKVGSAVVRFAEQSKSGGIKGSGGGSGSGSGSGSSNSSSSVFRGVPGSSLGYTDTATSVPSPNSIPLSPNSIVGSLIERAPRPSMIATASLDEEDLESSP